MKTNRVRNFFRGAGQVLVLAPSAEYIYPKRGDFQRDRSNLRKDAINFSRDLYAVSEKKYGEVQSSED